MLSHISLLKITPTIQLQAWNVDRRVGLWNRRWSISALEVEVDVTLEVEEEVTADAILTVEVGLEACGGGARAGGMNQSLPDFAPQMKDLKITKVFFVQFLSL